MSKRLYRPRPASVRVSEDGRPLTIGRSDVEAVREQWLVEDRWWTSRPLRRHYFELMTAEGANRIVFRDIDSERWFTQRGA
jgi:hypothetical protein